MPMKEWIVSTVEERRYNVDYFVEAKNEEDARFVVAHGVTAKLVSEDDRMDCVISQRIVEVAENT